MHEVRISAPEGNSDRVVGLAIAAGIQEAAVYEVSVRGPRVPGVRRKQVISVETSTPRAKKFVDALFAAEWFDPQQYSITTRELRAIFAGQSVAEITYPMIEPGLEVLEDLWQLSHITLSYVARAAGGAVLMAYGMLEGSAISLVVAAMILPFLANVLAACLGPWFGEWKLTGQALKALGLSAVLSVAAGALVAWLHGPPIKFQEFQTPLVAFGISAVIGVAAGLASADDAGRKYLIGVAAAVQYAVFPIWFGACLVLGFPDRGVALQRMDTFAINLATIGGIATLMYSLCGMKREDVKRYRSKRG